MVQAIEDRVRQGRTPKAIVVAHIYGLPADLAPVAAAAREHGIPLIEDAAESLGATYHGRQVGTHGAVGCFSFNGNKVITSGGGGMIVTDDPALARRARHLTTQARVPGLEYWHDEIGYNYRLTNLQAALGLAQLEQLDRFNARKREIAERYNEAFACIEGIDLRQESADMRSSWWMYTVLINPPVFGRTRTDVIARLDAAGIGSRPLWTPLHTMQPFASAPYIGGGVAADLFARGLSLPCSVALDSGQQEAVIAAVRACAAR
jgi:dTDP-4-amino-4,6-dideoxygalactose transaminase